jgi:hypothetical protein
MEKTTVASRKACYVPSLTARESPGGSDRATQSDKVTGRAATTPVTCDKACIGMGRTIGLEDDAYLACTRHMPPETRRDDPHKPRFLVTTFVFVAQFRRSAFVEYALLLYVIVFGPRSHRPHSALSNTTLV